jgi:hypothetical protein
MTMERRGKENSGGDIFFLTSYKKNAAAAFDNHICFDSSSLMGNGPSSDENATTGTNNHNQRITQTITGVLADTLRDMHEIKEEESRNRGILSRSDDSHVRLMGSMLSSAAQHWMRSAPVNERENQKEDNDRQLDAALRLHMEHQQADRHRQRQGRDRQRQERERAHAEWRMHYSKDAQEPRKTCNDFFTTEDNARDAIIKQYCEINKWNVSSRLPARVVDSFEESPLPVAAAVAAVDLSASAPPTLHVPPRLIDKEAPAGTPEERLCQVCLVNIKCVVMQPCGQVVTCLQCTQRLFTCKSNHPACPGCAQPVTSAQGMFL